MLACVRCGLGGGVGITIMGHTDPLVRVTFPNRNTIHREKVAQWGSGRRNARVSNTNRPLTSVSFPQTHLACNLTGNLPILCAI